MRAHRADLPPACAFGTPAAKAETTVALLGDSHSTHWRAAIAYLARKRQWHGVSMNRNLCPFTLARAKRYDRCKGWTRGALRWLGKHPEVKTLFVSANAGSGVQAVRGQTQRETKIAGYQRAWSAIPRSVREVFVLRDVPRSRADTADCVTRAVARRRNPAVRCARPRGKALTPDLEAEAAELDPADRVKAIDLTSFMCDERSCLPVVGGALVIKDIGHMTRTFSRTLGPFLGRAIDARRRADRRTALRHKLSVDARPRAQEDDGMRARATRHLNSVSLAAEVTAPGPAMLATLPLAPEEFDWRDYAAMLLHVAAEIEHALMVEYLFAAYSLGGPDVPEPLRAKVREWQEVILGIAKEEMGHLVTVQNVLTAIGAPLNLDREDYPFGSPFYPFRFSLEPLSLGSLAAYVCAESPPDWSGDEADEIRALAAGDEGADVIPVRCSTARSSTCSVITTASPTPYSKPRPCPSRRRGTSGGAATARAQRDEVGQRPRSTGAGPADPRDLVARFRPRRARAGQRAGRGPGARRRLRRRGFALRPLSDDLP